MNEQILEFFKLAQTGKLKNHGKHDFSIISDTPGFTESLNFIKDKYENCGEGIKYIIKNYDLPITYSILRFYIINFFGIQLRENAVCTEFLKKFRKDKAIFELENRTGFHSDEIVRHANKISRGIQGYYFNKSKNKFVWLRSSWEYIYAKWLDFNNITWDIEVASYKLTNSIYRPDFFIYDELDKLVSIVEVKGYWKNRLYKFNELKTLLSDIDVVLIDEIKPYTKSVKNDIKEWKINRILKIN